MWSENLRYDYPSLTTDSIVFDVGGFEGTWADNIYHKYLCNIYVFEPVKRFYDIIKNKLRAQSKVRIYNFGLGTKDEKLNIRVNGSSTSIFSRTENTEEIEIKDIEPIINEFEKIDLIKINIEGAEYDLLEYIIEKKLQTKFINIQIQFHIGIVPNYEERRQKIREELSKTHHLTYDYPYTHENWELNETK